MYRRVARFFLDAEHDFVLERSAMKNSRLKVMHQSFVSTAPPPTGIGLE